MTRTLLFLILAFTYSGVHAQGGWIAPSADQTGTMCQKDDLAPGIFDVYIVHHSTTGTVGAQFSVVASAGFTGLFLEFQTPFVHIGIPSDGITICYGACMAAPHNIGTARYFGFGTSGPCSRISVQPSPYTGLIESVDCSETIVYAGGGELWVNPEQWCHCYINTTEPAPSGAVDRSSGFSICTVANRNATWGKIKALYE